MPRVVDRFGPARIAPIGLLLMAGGFALFSTVGVHSEYLHLLIGVLLLGTGFAPATTPATTAIVSSLPQNKQGVASAVNDAAREVGGALVIDVLDGALTGRYRTGLASAVVHLPPNISAHAKAALAAALAIAKQLGPKGTQLAAHAQASFVNGLGLAMIIAAASVAAVAAFVFWRAPRERDDGRVTVLVSRPGQIR